MVKTKKLTKTSSAVTPSLASSWFDINKSIDNPRQEMEKGRCMTLQIH